MATKDFKILGFKALDRALLALGPKIEKKLAKGAIRAGAREILLEARATVPRGSGKLRKALQLVPRRTQGAPVISVLVRRPGARGAAPTAPYAHIVEFGAPQYGRAAVPFMRRAMDTKQKDVVKAIAKYIRDRIAKLAAEVSLGT